MRNSPIYCKPPPHSDWRNGVKDCPVCREKFWPTEMMTRKNWLVKQYCSNACNAKAKTKLKQPNPKLQ